MDLRMYMCMYMYMYMYMYMHMYMYMYMYMYLLIAIYDYCDHVLLYYLLFRSQPPERMHICIVFDAIEAHAGSGRLLLGGAS